jgi:nucleotidyltransferase substrate binding protein (TIGR01987 family)
MLELESFEKALKSLEELSKQTENKELMDNFPEILKRGLIAGLIQNFEFTYELSWKYIKRWLENNLGNTEVDGVSRRQLFRLAIENKLIEDVETWMKYHYARNRTSHTYNISTAEEVYEVALEFLKDAKKLLVAIGERND